MKRLASRGKLREVLNGLRESKVSADTDAAANYRKLALLGFDSPRAGWHVCEGVCVYRKPRYARSGAIQQEGDVMAIPLTKHNMLPLSAASRHQLEPALENMTERLAAFVRDSCVHHDALIDVLEAADELVSLIDRRTTHDTEQKITYISAHDIQPLNAAIEKARAI
jgi:hypothetical protein